jgi:hypothetical protein
MTVIVAVPTTSVPPAPAAFARAWIVAVPLASVFTLPLELTVAMLGLSETHVIVRV